MRESLDLRTFDVGLVSNPDQQDIPLEAQTEGSYNLDVQTQGKLKGIPKQTSASIYGYESEVFGWIQRDSDIWDLVYSDGANTKIITDFYGTQALSSPSGLTGYPARVIIPNNREVHLGMGRTRDSKWAGYISHGQFGGSAPTDLYVTNSEPAQPSTSHSIVVSSTTAASTAADATFPKGNMYHYMFSFIYDGYQESPLNRASLATLFATKQVTTDITSINLTLTISSYSTLNKRITGVRVYRREKPFFDSSIYADYQEFLDTTSKLPYRLRPQRNKNWKQFQTQIEEERYEVGSFGDYGEFKLIKDIDINDTSWTTSGANKVYTVTDSNTNVGASYYSNTGLDERVFESVSYGVNYYLGAIANNYLFVSNASHPDIPDEDAVRRIFRSMPNRYDTFDVYNNFVIMPSIPTAIESHRNKLYVWDENNLYVVDPERLSIVETITGRGCSSQRSLVKTDYGLFWANKNGVYWSTLTEELIQPTKDNLSEPIKTQYQTSALSNIPIVVYNSPRSQLLVHLDDDIYAYNTVEKRWDYYNNYKLVSQESVCGAFIGKDGETYTVTDNDLYEDFSDTDRKPWIFYSKEFTFDDASQDKKFYKIVADSSGSTLLKYSLDGGTTWEIFTSGDLQDIERAKTLKLYISGLDATSTVDSISIIYRRLRGKR